MSDVYKILEVYGETIKEELNVKDVLVISQPSHIKKIIKPLGQRISALYGKDTADIIKYGKAGNIDFKSSGNVLIHDGGNRSWELKKDDYEIVYEGIDAQTMAADSSYIVELDMYLDQGLKEEGVVREISRFLNQMRKDAKFQVDDVLKLSYLCLNDGVKKLMNEYEDFLKKEVLLSQLECVSSMSDSKYSVFEDEECGTIQFSLRK